MEKIVGERSAIIALTHVLKIKKNMYDLLKENKALDYDFIWSSVENEISFKDMVVNLFGLWVKEEERFPNKEDGYLDDWIYEVEDKYYSGEIEDVGLAVREIMLGVGEVLNFYTIEPPKSGE